MTDQRQRVVQGHLDFFGGQPSKAELARAWRWEQEHPDGPGWTWEDARVAPTTLTRLVVEGSISVVGQDERGRNLYRLTRE